MKVRAKEKFEDTPAGKVRRPGDEFEVDREAGHRMIRHGHVEPVQARSQKDFSYSNKAAVPFETKERWSWGGSGSDSEQSPGVPEEETPQDDG